ncbi:unnamed protein product [Dibothriocephalus latus]|uniref:Uncharacterized protein n=1 Tax=Dibothriocephalus latus TaxID=60516 RepID=A0A3P6Q1S7_DIBLA|nr:unnamed protein product [Dibothriocephalus latus]
MPWFSNSLHTNGVLNHFALFCILPTQEANELQRRITTFTNAVDTRREMLDLACGFYGHAKEVLTCLHGFSESYNPGEHFPPNIEGVEDELTNFHQDRSSLEAAIEQVNAEGNVLIGRLQDADEVTHLRSILHQASSLSKNASVHARSLACLFVCLTFCCVVKARQL